MDIGSIGGGGVSVIEEVMEENGNGIYQEEDNGYNGAGELADDMVYPDFTVEPAPTAKPHVVIDPETGKPATPGIVATPEENQMRDLLMYGAIGLAVYFLLLRK